MKKVVVFFATGFEEVEGLAVVDILRRAGVSVDICSLNGEYVTGSHNITIKSDILIENIDIDQYQCIVLPGGLPGATNLRDDERIIEFIKSFDEKGKLIAAICAAPIVLERAGIIRDREVTSYPGSLENSEKFNYKEEIVVRSENLITSRGPATVLEFAYSILNAMDLKEKADALREGMMVNFYNKNI